MKLSDLAWTIGRNTATLYLLDPTGSFPVEPIMTDLLPGVTPFRQTLDALEQDVRASTYQVTQHALWPLDVTSNVKRAPRTATVSGTITNSPILPDVPGLPSPNNLPQPSLARVDVFRHAMLERLADQRRLVMLVTPHHVLTPAVITSVQLSWSPDAGLSVPVSVTLQEVQLIVSPLLAAAPAADGASMTSGSLSTTGGGQQAPTQSTLQATPSATPGNAPTIGAA